MAEGAGTPSHAAVPQIPVEYDDLYIQRGSYANQRDFSHDINKRMKMPNRLSVDGKNLHDLEVENMHAQSSSSHVAAAGMAIPDKITLSGSGSRGALDDQFGFMSSVGPENRDYVNITTPPRVLTVDERFPVIEDEEVSTPLAKAVAADVSTSDVRPDHLDVSASNAQLVLASTNADQVLVQRIQNLELKEKQRETREMIIYSIFAVYLTYKFFKGVMGR